MTSSSLFSSSPSSPHPLAKSRSSQPIRADGSVEEENNGGEEVKWMAAARIHSWRVVCMLMMRLISLATVACGERKA